MLILVAFFCACSLAGVAWALSRRKHSPAPPEADVGPALSDALALYVAAKRIRPP